MSNDEHLTASSLLQRAQSREEDAWRRLVSLYTPLVFYWCHGWGLRQTQSEDVVQEVFLKVHGGLPGFERRSAGSFRKWLYVIARNAWLDHVKAAGAGPVGGSDQQRRVAELPGPRDEESEEQLTEGRLLLYRQAVELIRQEFSATDWLAFWRTAVEGKPTDEVAESLEITTNVVYIARSKIRRRVREEFDHLVE